MLLPRLMGGKLIRSEYVFLLGFPIMETFAIFQFEGKKHSFTQALKIRSNTGRIKGIESKRTDTEIRSVPAADFELREAIATFNSQSKIG